MPKLILNKDKFLSTLKEIKNEEKLNMSEISREMGIDRSHLFRVLVGKQDPGRKFIEGALKICKGCSLDELFSSVDVVTKIPDPKRESA